MALSPALVILAAAGLAAFTYLGLERLGRRALLPAALRAVAWACLGLLAVNPGCPGRNRAARPLVLLDGSLSMGSAGGRWEEVRDAAARAGDVRLFGDPDLPASTDSVPAMGQSRLGPALAAALASGRPVVVMTDGEITDAGQLDPSLLGQAAVRLFQRRDGPAAGVAMVDGPGRARERDSIMVRVVIAARGLGARALEVTAQLNGRQLARTTATTTGNGTAAADLVLPPGSVPPGEHLISVGLSDSVDAERRDDRRWYRLVVSATPGIVVAAAAPDWDARFLYRTLAEVTRLPVEGYVQLPAGSWRRMDDLSPVPGAAVEAAVRRAELAVLRGPAAWIQQAGGASVLAWPVAPDGAGTADWYLAAGSGGPVQSALGGAPVDSFPPATALVELSPSAGGWTGLTAQAGRRGALRPALVGEETAGRRRVTIGVEGLWRWAFRGGSSEQAYRALVASVADWLLARPDSSVGAAVPLRSVVPRGRPLVFQSRLAGAGPLAVRFQDQAGTVVSDSLRFDGAGRGEVRLQPAVYVYSLERGGRGQVAVEQWSDEWFPRPVTLREAAAGPMPPPAAKGIREQLWLVALAVAALSAEWFLRRRMGLR